MHNNRQPQSYKRLIITACLLMAGFGDPAYAGPTDHELHLVEQFAPAPTEKEVSFFKSQRFEAGTGCKLKYARTETGIHYSWHVIDDKEELRKIFQTAPVQINTWWAEPALCSSATQVETGSDWIKVSAPGVQHTAQSVVFTPQKFSLRQRSIESFTSRFGAPFFRGENKLSTGNRTNLFAQARFENRLTLTDYQHIELTLDAELVNAEVVKGCVSGTAPVHAQNCYDPRKMATQFRLAFGNIVWRDPRCTTRSSGSDLCKHQGRAMQATISLFDERMSFRNDDFHVQRGNYADNSIRIPIYRIDIRNFLPNKEQNPFHIPGMRTRIRGDILPSLRAGLLLGERLRILPPRLMKAGGMLETDDDYVSHYSLGGINIGFEVSGLSDVTYDIYELSLVARRQ